MKRLFKTKRPKVEQQVLLVQQTNIPVTIYYENRSGYRCSFTKKGLNIRIPALSTKSHHQQLIKACTSWAKEMLAQKPQLLQKYQTKAYQAGQKIVLFDKTYTLQLAHHQKETITTTIKENVLQISIPANEDFSIIEPKHLSKAFAKNYRAFFQERLNEWNAFFPVQHNTMRLKYNSSNWGSCSSKRNINLSTRLLLCPEDVIDYVIVHELAHLIQQNHSKAFWAEVARVLPNYKQQVQWLKTKGAHLDF